MYSEKKPSPWGKVAARNELTDEGRQYKKRTLHEVAQWYNTIMDFHSNKELTRNSQSLRKNMTPQERKLWYDFLKTLPYPVKRQHVIGRYIADFYCEKTKTVIEIDGSQHFEETGIAEDIVRNEYFRSLGLKILRFSNAEVNTKFKGVCKSILIQFGLATE